MLVPEGNLFRATCLLDLTPHAPNSDPICVIAVREVPQVAPGYARVEVLPA